MKTRSLFLMLLVFVPMSLAAQDRLEQVALERQLLALNDVDGRGFLQSVLTAELRFVKKVCDPTDEQLRQIRITGFQETERLTAAYESPKVRRGFRTNRKRIPRPGNPNHAICMALLDQVANLFPEEVADRYAKEVESRALAQREANALMLTTLVSQRVLLGPKEFKQLHAKLVESWDPSWSTAQPAMMYPMHARGPSLELLKSVLSDVQVQLWEDSFNPRPANLVWQFESALSNMLPFMDSVPISGLAIDQASEQGADGKGSK